MNENCFLHLRSLSLADVVNSTVTAHLRERFATLESLYLKTSVFENTVIWTLNSKCRKLHVEAKNSSKQNSSTLLYLDLPPSLQSLTLRNYVNSLKMLADIDSFSRDNLKHLDISFNESIKRNLSLILCHYFPSLRTLILRACKLVSQDLSSLAQANVEGRLPKLRHLDISSNRLHTNEFADSTFHHSCEWNQLMSLNIMNTGISPEELNRKVQSGCLSSLQELRISDYPRQAVTVIYPHLQILGVNKPDETVLSNIADAVEEGKVPSLHSVCINQVEQPLHTVSVFHRLTARNISCHKYTNLVESKCVCQQKTFA